MRDPGLGEDAGPLLPVGPVIQRPAVRLGEHHVVVLPYVRRGDSLGELGGTVRSQRGDQFGRQRDRLAAVLLDLAEVQPAASPLRARFRPLRARGRVSAAVPPRQPLELMPDPQHPAVQVKVGPPHAESRPAEQFLVHRDALRAGSTWRELQVLAEDARKYVRRQGRDPAVIEASARSRRFTPGDASDNDARAGQS